MSVLLCLNELSCDSTVEKSVIDDCMVTFVRLLQEVRRLRGQAALITPHKLPGIKLSDKYEMAQWVADGRNRDLWRVIRRMQDRAPFTYDEVVSSDVITGVDYFYGDRAPRGLAVAHMIGALAVSLSASDEWHSAKLSLKRLLLAELAEEEILEDQVHVRHASSLDHVEAHKTWITSDGLDQLSRGRNIWESRHDFFPHLVFLPRVEQDLDSLTSVWVRPVRELLAELEAAVAEWNPAKDPFPNWKYVTPEGERRRLLCEFEDIDGTSRFFDLHARFAPEPGRLHLRLVREDGTAHIAYIGRKLGA